MDDYSDEELLHYIRQSPRLVITVKQAVLILSPGLLAKAVGGTCYDDPMDEICAMQRARALGINVPAFRRLVPADDCGTHYLVMERVIGDTLEKRWRNLGLWGTLRAAWKLRGYLRLLRTVTAQTTGGLHSGRTRCPWLDDQRGPVRNASPVAFVGYLNWWLVDCRPQYCTPHPELVLKLAKEHILVHQDLAPRNMILDPRGTLWLVDWGISGFYPEYMEFFWDRRHIVVTLDVVVEGTHMGGMVGSSPVVVVSLGRSWLCFTLSGYPGSFRCRFGTHATVQIGQDTLLGRAIVIDVCLRCTTGASMCPPNEAFNTVSSVRYITSEEAPEG